MSKSWRERSAEARARGYFSQEDFALWRNTGWCPAAEAVRAYRAVGIIRRHGLDTADVPAGWDPVWDIGSDLVDALRSSDFDDFDRLLDAIDDCCLRIKREGHA